MFRDKSTTIHVGDKSTTIQASDTSMIRLRYVKFSQGRPGAAQCTMYSEVFNKQWTMKCLSV